MALRGSEIERAAERILADYDAGHANEIFAERGTAWLTVEDAYAVQRAVAELRRARGEQCLGYKVGCLSPTIQKQFGLQEPVHGYIWRSEMLTSGSSLSCDSSKQEGKRFVNPAIEGEIAFRLAHDISSGMPYDNLLASVECWFPVIELHNYVFCGPSPTSQELVAGNGMHAGFVAALLPARPLSELTNHAEIEIKINGELVETKVVAEIPDGPLGSVRWLASLLARTKENLEAGDIVLTGSPGKLIPIVGNSLVAVTCERQRVELTIERPIAK